MLLRAKSETNSNSQATDSAVVSFRRSSISFFLSRVSPTFFVLPRAGLPRLDPLRDARETKGSLRAGNLGFGSYADGKGEARGDHGDEEVRDRRKEKEENRAVNGPAISASSPILARAHRT